MLEEYFESSAREFLHVTFGKLRTRALSLEAAKDKESFVRECKTALAHVIKRVEDLHGNEVLALAFVRTALAEGQAFSDEIA